MLVGQAHEQRAAHPRLQVLRGHAGQVDRRLVRVDHRRDRDDGVVQPEPLARVLGVGRASARWTTSTAARRRTPGRRRARRRPAAATRAESMPPDRPSTTEGMPFLSMKSRRPSTRARQTSSQSLSGLTIVDGRGSNGGTGSSESRCRVTVSGPTRPSVRSATAARSKSGRRSAGARRTGARGPAARRRPRPTSESPSKTSSSCPPTWLQ